MLEPRLGGTGLLEALERPHQQPTAGAPPDGWDAPGPQAVRGHRATHGEGEGGAQHIAVAAGGEVALPHRRTRGDGRVARRVSAYQYAVPDGGPAALPERDRRHERRDS